MANKDFTLALHGDSFLQFLITDKDLKEGMYTAKPDVTYQQIAEALYPQLTIASRLWLENDPGFKQVIPYAFLYRVNRDGTDFEYLPYRRAKGSGEERLLGKVAIGFGGHIDLSDITDTMIPGANEFDPGVVFNTAMQREISEELSFEGNLQVQVQPMGVLYNADTPVNSVHVGLAVGLRIESRDLELKAKEESVTLLPWMTANELLNSDYELEDWTRYVLQFIEKQGNAIDANVAETTAIVDDAVDTQEQTYIDAAALGTDADGNPIVRQHDDATVALLNSIDQQRADYLAGQTEKQTVDTSSAASDTSFSIPS